MRKNLLIATISGFLIMLLLSSCSLRGPHFMKRLFDNDQEVANKRFEQILDAIKDRDESALKKLFSKKSITEANDLDGNIIELFDFFKGKVVSCNDWGSSGAEEGRNDDGTGRHWKSIESTYDVETSEQKYRFAIKEFMIDTAGPDNIGIYSLYIINAKDTDEQFAYWGDGKWTAGIIFNQINESVD